jgi:hypothetical protein
MRAARFGRMYVQSYGSLARAETHFMILFLLLLRLTIPVALWSGYPPEVVGPSQSETKSVVEAEEYLVYSALINQKHTQPTAKRMFTLQGVLVKDRYVLDDVKLVVIESNTRTSFGYKPMNDENLGPMLRDKMPPVVEQTLQDFITKNQSSHTLTDKFNAKVRTDLIGEQERQSYFLNSTARMEEFFTRYSGSQGTLAFSRVGFSPNKDKALVYVDAQQDFNAEFKPIGTWNTYFALLTKGTDGWMIQAVHYPNRLEPESLTQRWLPVDLRRCDALSQSFAWGLGSESVEIKGLKGGKCVLEHFSEIEGGYSRTECLIPTSLGQVSISPGTASFYYSQDLSKFCKVIKTGNIFFDVFPLSHRPTVSIHRDR